MRAFVAVELDEPVREAVGRAIERLRGGPTKWVARKNLHLTLKFLGEVPDETLPDAIDILRRCTEGLGPFDLIARGVGAFPNLKRPRVVFVEAEDRPPTAHELARRLNREMTRAGVPKEDRGFKGHVTLGRIRVPKPVPGLDEGLAGLAEAEFGTTRVDRVVLMKSDLTPQGTVYPHVETVPLLA